MVAKWAYRLLPPLLNCLSLHFAADFNYEIDNFFSAALLEQ